MGRITQIPSAILLAAKGELPLSELYSEDISKIARSIENQFGVPLAMNPRHPYASANCLCIEALGRPGHKNSSTQRTVKLCVWVSENGPFFAFRYLISSFADWPTLNGEFVRKSGWKPLPRRLLSPKDAEFSSRVAEFLTGLGLNHIPDRLLSRKIPGVFRRIDGCPADVFDALFSEIH